MNFLEKTAVSNGLAISIGMKISFPVRFYPGIYYEDVLFVTDAVFYVGVWGAIDYCGYYWGLYVFFVFILFLIANKYCSVFFICII